jgi:PAS domain S-box-containing protein
MAAKRIEITRNPERAVAVGVAMLLLSWPAAAGLDALFDGGGFLRHLWPEAGEIVCRLFFMTLQLVYVLYISRLMLVHRQQGRLLEQALAAAETEKKRKEEILEAVGDAISMQDLDMKILYQNRAHKELMGSHVGEYCYQAYQQKEALCGGCHLAQSYLDGKTHRNQTSAQTKHGRRFTEIISTPLRDGEGRIVAGIEAVRDVTEGKNAELELQRVNGQLQKQAAELAEANRELESFSYSLSHDLRSYITRISTAQQLLEFDPQAQEPAARYLVKSIDDSCQGMEELIEAMLTLCQLSRQELSLTEVSLSGLAEEILLQLQQEDLERQVEISIARDVTVKGDAHLLKVAMENLLGNAWKYSGQVPVARIEFGRLEQDGRPRYFVRDNGTGFDMKERDKLFKPFQRLQNSQGFHGTGVGLATVQRVIQRHGGEVWGEGEPGRGAVFYFTLAD